MPCSYLTGLSHFPDPGGLEYGVGVRFPLSPPLIPLQTLCQHSIGLAQTPEAPVTPLSSYSDPEIRCRFHFPLLSLRLSSLLSLKAIIHHAPLTPRSTQPTGLFKRTSKYTSLLSRKTEKLGSLQVRARCIYKRGGATVSESS